MGLLVVGAAVAIVATGGLAGVGIAAALSTKAALGVAAVGAGAATTGYVVGKSQVHKGRRANAALAHGISGSALDHYYAAGRTSAFRNMDAIRAGLSYRGEFWNVVDAKPEVHKYAQQIFAMMEGSKYQAAGEAVGGGLQGGLKAFRRGRF